MLNHKDISLIYDAGSIIDILQDIPLPVTDSDCAVGCNAQEVERISNVLNLGLPIKAILYFRLKSGFEGSIHKDVNLNAPDSLATIALNLPLANCEQVSMKWYTQNVSTVNDESFAGPKAEVTAIAPLSTLPLLNKNNATCIDTINYNSAKLVNVSDWHAVDNHSTEDYAYFISVRFMRYVNTSMEVPMNEWL